MPAIHEYIHVCMHAFMYACIHSMTFIVIILLTIDMSNVLLNEWETV